MVHIDEVDKICPRGLISGTVNTRACRRLLKLMEDAEVPLKGKKGDSESSSRRSMFCLSSRAFEQLSSVYASEGVRAPQPRDLINAGCCMSLLVGFPLDAHWNRSRSIIYCRSWNQTPKSLR